MTRSCPSVSFVKTPLISVHDASNCIENDSVKSVCDKMAFIICKPDCSASTVQEIGCYFFLSFKELLNADTRDQGIKVR